MCVNFVVLFLIRVPMLFQFTTFRIDRCVNFCTIYGQTGKFIQKKITKNTPGYQEVHFTTESFTSSTLTLFNTCADETFRLIHSFSPQEQFFTKIQGINTNLDCFFLSNVSSVLNKN